MGNMPVNETKITIGDITLWSRPWTDGKALLSANEGGLKLFLYEMHKRYPDHVQLLVDDDDFSKEDLKGCFSVITDSTVSVVFRPASGKFELYCYDNVNMTVHVWAFPKVDGGDQDE